MSLSICDEILKITGNLKTNKSSGHDNLRPKLVKNVADYVVFPIQRLFNISFESGIVPSKLKIAKVIPIFKKGDRVQVSNYRPISLLNVFDKLMY